MLYYAKGLFELFSSHLLENHFQESEQLNLCLLENSLGKAHLGDVAKQTTNREAYSLPSLALSSQQLCMDRF